MPGPRHGAGRRRPGLALVRRRQAQGLRRDRHRRRSGVDLPATPPRPRSRRVIDELNADPACTGFIVQQPHRGSTSTRCSRASTPTRTSTACTRPTSASWCSASAAPLPCTPVGIVELLRRHGVRDRRRRGRRGRPRAHRRPPARAAADPRSENATVTLCHTGTRDLAAHVRSADIVVAAAGVPGIITADMVKPGAAVLDVGRLPGRRQDRRRRGRRRLGRRRLGLAQPRRGRPDDPRDAAVQRRRDRRAAAG